MQISNFSGFDSNKFWIGEIEDIHDPLGMGRCKVRVIGYHTDDKKVFPTDDLPWAHPMFAMNMSKSYFAPNLGDWVLGMYLDGNTGQFAIMLGVLPGLQK